MSADTPAVDFAAILCPCSAVAPPYTGMAPGWMKGSAWDWVPCDHSQSMAHYVLSAMHDTPDHPPFDCPDCPTIGKLLAIGTAVIVSDFDEQHPRNEDGSWQMHCCHCGKHVDDSEIEPAIDFLCDECLEGDEL